MVQLIDPVPSAPPDGLARAKRAEARRLAREPWRDPASEHYGRLRAGTGVEGGVA